PLSPSSTSSSEQRTGATATKRGRRTPLPIIVALIVLAAAERTLRATASSLAPLNSWNDWEATNKVERMDALAARGGASVVFVGSSMVNAAADPALFSRLLGVKRPAFNAALNGASARLIDLWTLDVVVPRLRPKVVVIGLSSRELNDNGFASARIFRAVRRSPGGRSIAGDLSPTERIQSIGERALYLVRYRTRLRHPSTLTADPEVKRPATVGPLGVLDALRIFDHATYRVPERFRDEVFPQSLDGFVMGGKEFDALGHLVSTLITQKIRVVLVEMPVTDDTIAAHPQGANDYRRFEDVVGIFARSTQLVDADAWFPGTSDFADPMHLNGTGREEFTRRLAALMTAAG
ncbi:MAG: hypothetical protein ACRDKS_07250, partial [Actinomycetota bacterium]